MQLSLNLEHIIPAEMDMVSTLLFIAVFGLGIMLASILIRWIIGKNSALNRTICSTLGILMVYVATILIYTFNPQNLSAYLSPLPFVRFSGDQLILFSFTGNGFAEICREMLSMVVLAFLVHILDGLIPDGKSVTGWSILRILTVLGAMAAHYFINRLFDTYIPGILDGYAPVILFCIVIFLLLLGILKVLLGIFLTVINPIFGVLYTFFFSSKIGKQLSGAILTMLILTAFVFALEYLGFGAISVSVTALQSYIPALAVIIILWYVIGNYL